MALLFSRPVSSRRVVHAALLAVLALLASAPDAFAQDPFSEFFGGLFGGGGQPRSRPAQPSEPRVRRMMPHQENRPPTYWRGAGSAAKRSAKRTEPSEKIRAEAPEAAASYFVLAMGDSLALQLGNGLEETFADKPDIGVLKKAKESSGLVRDDYFDWPKAAREAAAGPQKIDVAVIMMGSNDRQTLRQGGAAEEALSPRWREIYAARVDAVLAPFREKKIPVVWVGLPIMKSEGYAADMAKLNEIFRDRVAAAGGVYIDLWEALADERGQYSAFGPDINGQIVKLRAADGVHLTEAGGLNVAHFVANELKKFYEGRRSVEPAPMATAPDAGGQPPASPQPGDPAVAAAPANAAPLVFQSPVRAPTAAPALPDRPAIGAVQTLTGPPTAPGVAELARRAPAAASSADAQALARHVFVEGGDQPARANRADDHSWKPPAP